MKPIAALVTAAAILSASTSVHAQNLRMLVSWPSNDKPAHGQALEFKRIVEQESKGKITFQVFGPEVVPAFEQLQPVVAGVFDVLVSHGAYHGGNKGLTLVGDAMDPDPAKRRAAGVFDYLDNYYQKTHGIKLLSLPIMGHDGYHCFLKAPLTADGDWNGRKLRGSAPLHGVIRSLGGSPVALPVPETYTAIEKGVVDGSCMPAAGMVAYKLYEVAKYRVEPFFGNTTMTIGINMNKWNSLPKETQAILIEAGKKAEPNGLAFGDGLVKAEHEELAKQGVTVLRLSPAKAKLMADGWSSTTWALGEKCCGDAAKELRQIAQKAGITQ